MVPPNTLLVIWMISELIQLMSKMIFNLFPVQRLLFVKQNKDGGLSATSIRNSRSVTLAYLSVTVYYVPQRTKTNIIQMVK